MDNPVDAPAASFHHDLDPSSLQPLIAGEAWLHEVQLLGLSNVHHPNQQPLPPIEGFQRRLCSDTLEVVTALSQIIPFPGVMSLFLHYSHLAAYLILSHRSRPTARTLLFSTVVNSSSPLFSCHTCSERLHRYKYPFLQSSHLLFSGATVLVILDKLPGLLRSLLFSIGCVFVHVGTIDAACPQSELTKKDFIDLFSILVACGKSVFISGPILTLAMAT